MGKRIGIDLGTTNSVMSTEMGKGQQRVLQNKENEDLTRSVVGSYKGQIIVGSPAIDRMVSVPKDTIVSVKRLMGRAYSDSDVQKVKKNYQYEIVPPSDGTEEDVRVVLGNRQYSPIQISSLIIKKLKEDAERRLNDKVESAVITVPAYFTEKQRDATRKAGLMAGLKVQRILDEPTAAALAFGIDNVKADEAKTILVYDLGGGTFDVSLLTIAGGAFAQLAIEGDMWLGGDDFDHKIMDYVLEHIKKEYDLDAHDNPRFMMELKKKAEQAKKNMSSMDNTDVTVMGLLQDEEGNLIDVEVELTREQFERMIEQNVKRSVELAEKAIQNANITNEQIDNVLLVGGSSTIPMVRRVLADKFGEKKILMNIYPMKCVSHGAGILASILGPKVECPKCKNINDKEAEVCAICGEPLRLLWNVTAHYYGIQTAGDKFVSIIEKSSPYPTPEPFLKSFYTSEAYMRRVKVPVYASPEDSGNGCELQGTVWLELPENVPQNTPVDVAIALDADMVLDVRVRLKDGSGREVTVFLGREYDGKRHKVEKKLDEIKTKGAKATADVDYTTKEKIEKIYDEVCKALNSNDIDAAEKKLAEIEKEIEKITKEAAPEWQRIADNVLSWVEPALENYSWLIESKQSYKIKKLMDEIKDTAVKGRQKDCEDKVEELLETLPGTVSYLINLGCATNIADNMNDIVTADKLRSARVEIENAMRGNNFDLVNRKVSELKPILDKLFKESGERQVEIKDDRLSDGKKG